MGWLVLSAQSSIWLGQTSNWSRPRRKSCLCWAYSFLNAVPSGWFVGTLAQLVSALFLCLYVISPRTLKKVIAQMETRLSRKVLLTWLAQTLDASWAQIRLKRGRSNFFSSLQQQMVVVFPHFRRRPETHLFQTKKMGKGTEEDYLDLEIWWFHGFIS